MERQHSHCPKSNLNIGRKNVPAPRLAQSYIKQVSYFLTKARHTYSTYTVASAPNVTDSIFLRRFRLFLDIALGMQSFKNEENLFRFICFHDSSIAINIFELYSGDITFLATSLSVFQATSISVFYRIPLLWEQDGLIPISHLPRLDCSCLLLVLIGWVSDVKCSRAWSPFAGFIGKNL